MKAKKQALVMIGAAVLLGGTTIAVQQIIKQARKRLSQAYSRWHPITVNRDPANITLRSEELKPLMDLGEAIEIKIAPAPGGKGTEIAARLSDSDTPDKMSKKMKMLSKLRGALRKTQWLVETGEILSPDKPSSIRRSLTSLPLGFAIRRARTGGRL